MGWVIGSAFAISCEADGQRLPGMVEAGNFARYLKGMYLSSLPEAVARSDAGDRAGFLYGVPNPGDKALFKMGLQKDVLHPNDSGFRRGIVVGIAGVQDDCRG